MDADALVAQLAEHILGKDEVGGSSPLGGSMNEFNDRTRFLIWLKKPSQDQNLT